MPSSEGKEKAIRQWLEREEEADQQWLEEQWEQRRVEEEEEEEEEEWDPSRGNLNTELAGERSTNSNWHRSSRSRGWRRRWSSGG